MNASATLSPATPESPVTAFLVHALPDFGWAMGAAIVLAGLTWLLHRAVQFHDGEVRQYTLLRTGGRDGTPLRYATTRRTGVIKREVDGHEERFELTKVRLYDGTYAAEPLDR